MTKSGKQSDGRSPLLYTHDAAPQPEETYDCLADVNIQIDFASLDRTGMASGRTPNTPIVRLSTFSLLSIYHAAHQPT